MVEMNEYPFRLSALPFDVNDSKSSWKWVEIKSDEYPLYMLLRRYIVVHVEDYDYGGTVKVGAQSYAVSDLSTRETLQLEACGASTCCSASGDKSKCDSVEQWICGRLHVLSSIGKFWFKDDKGNQLFALHQMRGSPVGTDCAVRQFESLVVFTQSSMESLVLFLSSLVERYDKCELGEFRSFQWQIKMQYWKLETMCPARTLNSIILPSIMKDELVLDITNFLSSKTREFYNKHGIPYRRSYLFYGVPGTGKTSLVRAMAGHFGRSVCFIQPTHPDMTDDSLRAAVMELPPKAIIVFEDIDMLFEKNRANKNEHSKVTFSGMLNALDGVGSPNGHIVVITTNLREQLDPALIRTGRVDMQFEFTYADKEQVCEMWSAFYPESKDDAEKFYDRMQIVLRGKHVTMSTVQHFFIKQAGLSADDALLNVVSGNFISEDQEVADVEVPKKRGWFA